MNFKIVVLLSFILILYSCQNDRRQRETSPDKNVSVEECADDVCFETFSVIDASRVTKLVVFIRDSTAISIDGQKVSAADKRISVANGVLKVAPVDTLKKHRIKSVRIYTPYLEQYNIRDCGEANISGNAVVGGKFVLNIEHCNLFRGNSYIVCNDVDLSFSQMLMSKINVRCRNLYVKARKTQHVELKGSACECTFETDRDAASFIDTLKLKRTKN